MSKEVKKKKKRLVCIYANTTSDEFECGEILKDCLKKLIAAPENEVRIFVNKTYCANSDNKHVTHVMVVGNSSGPWKKGMKLFCDCLEETDYFIHALLADDFFIPAVSDPLKEINMEE